MITLSISSGGVRGAARNNENASNKFDFPDPLIPTSTFNFPKGISSASGPKLRKLRNVIDLKCIDRGFSG